MFIFDLNRSVEIADRMRWEAPPIDTVMMLTALRTADLPPGHRLVVMSRPRLETRIHDDDDQITWEDAEWR